ELRRGLRLIEPAVGQSVDFPLHAGNKRAAQTLRTVELARAAKHGNSSGIEGAGQILPRSCRNGSALPMNRHRLCCTLTHPLVPRMTQRILFQATPCSKR